MIFGGLEIVAGGYLLHRHYKKKDKRKQFEENARSPRHNSFPGANPHHGFPQAQQCPQQQYPRQQCPQQQSPPLRQQPVLPQHKYACHAPTTPQPQPQLEHQTRPQSQLQSQSQSQPQPPPRPPPRPQPTHTSSFKIPRRPVPERKPQIIIQSLHRTDSFATISRMPIANGLRPQDEHAEVLPHRPNVAGLSPIPQSPYGNLGFSVSTPAFGATPTSPPVTYVMGTDDGMMGRNTVDDSWVAYGSEDRYAESIASTELGEAGPPPPPYMP